MFILFPDVMNKAGPTKFVLTIHLEAGAQTVDKALTMVLDRWMLDNWFDVVAPLLRVGEAIVYNYHVCHCSTSNIGTTT